MRRGHALHGLLLGLLGLLLGETLEVPLDLEQLVDAGNADQGSGRVLPTHDLRLETEDRGHELGDLLLPTGQAEVGELGLDLLRAEGLARHGGTANDVSHAGDLVDRLLDLVPGGIEGRQDLNDLVDRKEVDGVLQPAPLGKRGPGGHRDHLVVVTPAEDLLEGVLRRIVDTDEAEVADQDVDSAGDLV